MVEDGGAGSEAFFYYHQKLCSDVLVFLRLTDKSTFSINSLGVKNELCTGLGECAMGMLIHFVPSIHGQESKAMMQWN